MDHQPLMATKYALFFPKCLSHPFHICEHFLSLLCHWPCSTLRQPFTSIQTLPPLNTLPLSHALSSATHSHTPFLSFIYPYPFLQHHSIPFPPSRPLPFSSSPSCSCPRSPLRSLFLHRAFFLFGPLFLPPIFVPHALFLLPALLPPRISFKFQVLHFHILLEFSVQ